MAKKQRKVKYSWGIIAAIDVIGGKWKPLILYALMEETLRTSELLERIKPKISQRALTKEIRELERDDLVIRKVYPEVPPKVEYSLTAKGKTLIPILEDLCVWGDEHLSDIVEFHCNEEE
ncbi:helix-turn-helix domain-containing protein [uncultured Methanospirillum sp.]|uniref:winged helix-turn-helix transcriptional regulator n=1 Tax=uncultured Methanospirillum sp. TaxID=262503 RepID=UPI0029C7C1BA|nr:helix-turn-helix domain-containing protein [uncultured Methanospirillum sp.]